MTTMIWTYKCIAPSGACLNLGGYMKVKELFEELSKLIDVGHGDLQVRVEADHGQTPMKANCVGEGYISGDDYMPDGVHPDDLDDCPNAVKVIIIEGY